MIKKRQVKLKQPWMAEKDSNKKQSSSDLRSMMNVMFALLARRAFSDVLMGVNSKNFSFASLACSKPALF